MSPNPEARAAARILFVEDDRTFREVLSTELRGAGFTVATAADAETADRELEREEPDLVLLDERLPGRRGVEWLRALRQRGNDTPVIILTGHGDIETAVEAIQGGAFHFLTKPCDLRELTALIDRALEHRRLNRKAEALERVVRASSPADDLLVGRSRALEAIRDMIRRVAPAEAPVLLTGESGTGKELVARMVHRLSPRAREPFLALNCATLQDTLVEAELFGYERGAFTGANQPRAGLIEAADRGVLFLDELAELTLPAQAKLLRVLQEATYRRLGSSQERHCDVRLIAATNKPLPQAIEAGRFRQDLYFRLNILEIELPPLRDRREDLPLLAEHYFRIRGVDPPKEATSREVQEILSAYRWPGNVREFFNVFERVTILSGAGRFDRKILEHYVSMARAGGQEPLPDRLDDLEMMHIRNVLDRCRGNKTQAAKVLGISLKTLYNKLNRDKDGEPGEE